MLKRALLIAVGYLAVAISLNAQIVVLTNLSGASNGSSGISTSNPFKATSFTTGSQSGGYELTSLTWVVAGANPGDDGRVSIYLGDGDLTPPDLSSASALTTLNTSSVFPAGTQQELSTSISLAADTTYWVVFSAVNDRTYTVQNTSVAATSSYGWSKGTSVFSSSDNQATWTETVGVTHSMAFSVSAVPEPSSFAALSSIFVLSWVVTRRSRRRPL